MNELTKGLSVILAALYVASPMVNASSPATANVLNHASPSGWFIGAAGGALWANLPNMMTVNNGAPVPYNLDRYDVESNGAHGLLALMGGYKWARQSQWLSGIALALRYQRLFAKSLDGFAITQYFLPQFRNYIYSWALSTDLITLYSKIDLFHYQRFTPFIDVGVGIAMNHARRFHEVALSGVTPRISPAFLNRTHNNLAYNIGLGVDYALASQLTVSLGYDYQYLGAVKSGNGRATWSAERLDLGNYKGSSVIVGITYYMDNATSK